MTFKDGYCSQCTNTGSVPRTVTDGRVTEWKDCPDLDCKAFRDAKHKYEDKPKLVPVEKK